MANAQFTIIAMLVISFGLSGYRFATVARNHNNRAGRVVVPGAETVKQQNITTDTTTGPSSPTIMVRMMTNISQQLNKTLSCQFCIKKFTAAIIYTVVVLGAVIALCIPLLSFLLDDGCWRSHEVTVVVLHGQYHIFDTFHTININDEEEEAERGRYPGGDEENRAN